MDMEASFKNSTDFILLGLITHPVLPWLIFAVIFSNFVVAVHTRPWYFLLSELSIMDTMYICITAPKMLQDLLSKEKTISFTGCAVQIFLYVALIGGEFLLLGLMAYDRFVAVCKTLQYSLLVNCRICLLWAVDSWVGGSLDAFILTPMTMSFPYCGSQEVNHFFYESPVVLKLSYIDTSLYETLMYASCVLMLSIICVCYTQMLIIVHWMNSAEGQHKAFATSSSHIMVVSIFYGATFYTNVLPHSYHTPEKDKVMSAFYTILTPMLNPPIYSLRNKEVAAALKKVMGFMRGSCIWCVTLL